MNTLTRDNSFLRSDRARDNVIVLDDLEFSFSKRQLEKIKEYHNMGKGVREISQLILRDEYEVVLALLHFVRTKERIRPFGGIV